MLSLTNAQRAQIIVVINALMALIMSFGVGITDQQQGSITVAVNAVLGLWVAFTYKQSPRRTPDE